MIKKFQLEEPYQAAYRYGYMHTDPRTGRKQVRLTKHDGTTTTTSYARYLYNVSYLWDIFVKIGIDESTGLIAAILIYNAVCTLADKFMMKVVEEELDNKF